MASRSRERQKDKAKDYPSNHGCAHMNGRRSTITGPGSASATISKPSRATVLKQNIIAAMTRGRLLGGVVLATLLGMVGQGAVQEWHDRYYRPRLEMWSSTSAMLTTTHINGSRLENIALLLDVLNKCSIVGYRVTGEPSDTRPWGSTSQTFWKVFVYNSGRTSLSDVDFSLKSDRAEEAEVEVTPNLSVETSFKNSAMGIGSRVITIREIKPGVGGVLTVRADNASGILSVGDDQVFHISWAGTGQNVPEEFLFLGSRELGIKAKYSPTGARDILQRESEAYDQPPSSDCPW